MRRRVALLSTLILVIVLASGCTGPPRGVKRADLASDYVEAVFNEDYKELRGFPLTLQMRMSLFTKNSYRKVKKVFTDACGEYLETIDIRESELGDYRIVSVAGRFTETIADINVVFDKQNRIAGLHYKYNRTYETLGDLDEDVRLGSEYQLPGSLAIPKAAEKVPAVIIVHGSGPSERNGAVGGNAVYLELAEQLHGHGIASLRYDKRTYAYQEEMAAAQEGLTVYEETIDDVVEAFDFLYKNDDVDNRRIFIAGHSLGGYLMPRIADELPKAAGFIMLAPSASPMEDLILTQTAYIFNLDGKLSSEEKKRLLEYEVIKDRIKGLDEGSEFAPADLFGVPVSYWLDLQDYDPVSEMSDEGRMTLIIQGGRDYQVDLSEYARWYDGLGDRSHVEFLMLPELNHMMASGEGLSGPSEYDMLSHVDQRVGDAIAEFIRSQWGGK